jgi:diguanylate cyclase (GGDEF)-like protein
VTGVLARAARVCHFHRAMKQDLYLENQLLRRQLKELLAQARKNEQKFQRLNAYELRLIGSGSLLDLAQRVVHDYRSFGGAELVTLAIVDPLYEAQRILRDQGASAQEQPQLIFFGNEDYLNRLYNISVTPKLGVYKASAHAALFPHAQRAPASVALLPLVRNNELIGSLNLGSYRKEHFTSNPATEFLERLAAIVAMSLENCMNLERIKRVGLTDALTGVSNRRFFDQRLHEEVARSMRHGVPLTCLLLDIDHFKGINDNHGHPAGDRVLIGIAERIRAQLRGSDVLARYGGEEFAVLLTQTGNKDAQDIAERIRRTVAESAFRVADDKTLPVSLSIGVATLHGKREDTAGASSHLIECADQALYTAKHGGRNRVVNYEGDSDTRQIG